jgi:hypothetical protein
MNAIDYPNVGLFIFAIIFCVLGIAFLSIVYGNSIRVPAVNKNYGRKSYALLSEIPDHIETENLDINEI